jgi:Ran GTPase-activating protein (RanGAP) involved in mRNA processing and transport
LAELAQSPHTKKLAVLDLSRNAIGAQGVRALLDHAAFPALKVLRLNGARLGPAGGEALAQARFLPHVAEAQSLDHRLTTLEVSDNDLGPAGAAALVNRLPPGVRVLNLSRNGLGAGGTQALMDGWTSRGLRQLEYLDLSGNDLGTVGAEAVRWCRTLDRLTGLGLGHNGLGDEGMQALVAQARYSSWPHRCTDLALPGNGIGVVGIGALVQLSGAEFLTRLDLERNDLGAQGAEVLATSEKMAGLTDLNLAHNRLGPAGVENLMASPHLTKLTRLVLRGNGIGGRGVKALLAAHLEQVVELDVTGNKLDSDQVRLLRQRFGARVRA